MNIINFMWSLKTSKTLFPSAKIPALLSTKTAPIFTPLIPYIYANENIVRVHNIINIVFLVNFFCKKETGSK